MIIDIRNLKAKGKLNSDFRFNYKADNSLISIPGAKFDGDVVISGEVTIGGNTVYVDGTIEYSILGECSKCLDEALFHSILEFSETFEEQENEDCYVYHKGLVDLTPMVIDNLLTNFPSAIYCKEDCKGLCSVCGVNLNKTQCDCEK